MADVESEADDKFSNVDVDSILSRVGRRPLTFDKTRSLYKAPEFLKRLRGEETVNEGTTVQLETKLTGFPRPVLRWYKDDQEVLEHPRIHIESNGDGVYVFTVENVNKGDEAAYKCRAENEEGSTTSTFYLHVKVNKRSPKRKCQTKRSVSYPPMFPTIIEKVEEEEKEGKETARSPPSPLTQLYDGLTLQTRHTWPKFLGDWAYADNAHRNGGSFGSESDSEVGDGHSLESIEHDDDVFSEESSEKSSDDGPGSASFYVSSEEASPESPECLIRDLNGDSTKVSEETKLENIVVKNEPNNNQPTVAKGKRDMHLPLTNGLVSNTTAPLPESKAKETRKSDAKVASKKKDKDSSVKKCDEKKKSGEKSKESKKTEDGKSDNTLKKMDSKEKPVKKSDSKEKNVKKENTGVKKTDQKEEPKLKTKTKDGTKPPKDVTNVSSEKKLVKKSDIRDKKTDSPKKKSESKEKKKKADYITNPDPPMLGGSRPLVLTNLTSKIASCACTSGSEEDTRSLDGADVYTKAIIQSDESKQCKDISGEVVRHHGNKDLAIARPPVPDVPFGRFFEEFIFVVCLFTFLALCIGIPSETFVLVVLGMHFFYSMVTILGLC
ncbi:cylicin-1-like [Haliotis cracherodii]|uniref:cylicin-1-like n=1 Tax=Haliotis cracherodii TaxID=6455 RepID=UPI0039E823CD